MVARASSFFNHFLKIKSVQQRSNNFTQEMVDVWKDLCPLIPPMDQLLSRRCNENSPKLSKMSPQPGKVQLQEFEEFNIFAQKYPFFAKNDHSA